MTEVDDTTNCPVCFEAYVEAGEHVPRILPCHHSVCENCTEELLNGNTFTCPQCRKKHHADNGTQSFPQNKYIISLLKKTSDAKKTEKFDTCEDHNREMSLYCNGPKCLMAVCSLCMIKEHKEHEIKDLLEINKEKRDAITKGVQELQNNLQAKKETFVMTKQELDNMTAMCVEKIRQKKEEHMKMFDELMKEAVEHKREVKKKVEKGIVDIDENQEMLGTVMENIQWATYSGLVKNHEAFKEIVETSGKQITSVGTSKFPEYGESPAKNVCGKLSLVKFNQAQLQPGDESRGEGTFRFTVKNISKLTAAQISPIYMIRNLPWTVKIMPRYNRETRYEKFLAYFLQCNVDAESEFWTCQASAEMRLLSSTQDEPFSRSIKHMFCGDEEDWGFSTYILWNDVLDRDKGFYSIKDDSITLEVHIVAEEPRIVGEDD